ncbi:type I pantothenate kinase [Limosilactobacillus fermentum]|uniref:type I pantothenate kinase n=1 Tax=Limosilactobacillus fermentum TaxID=1613 RepID=UPI00071043E0|nr:type I pantothenate kinase [Limosilactobacillus fermentum]MCC6110749.1 type I pantothenate kinase [Limosilactobacillus fermentum]PHI33910.1 type I pantothenate kinase [Limosilactobacillus fermentum]WRQ24015.1 type I pantothenate kinase [Limosilactobacillus fermentum]SJM46328.1 Pantothenate kinase [Limosilactobacillus fermentum]SJM47670.1 Pantothenate kinase [Limosilactobacillus fermentum]
MDEWINYDQFDRQTWHSFFPSEITFLTQENLDEIKSLNDQISLRDVQDIYLPLIKLIQLQYQNYQQMQLQKMTFLRKASRRIPYIIGIAGSVAVGKSTTARLLQILLKRLMPDRRIEMITTDGFLYPNAELKRRGIMARKGFPESYDMDRLLTFMNDVNAGEDQVTAPTYSHSVYDVMEDHPQTIYKPDILIVEGINVLQLPTTQRLFVSDFFDFSVYVDADASLVEKWYLERFGMLLDTAFQDPTNYYYPYAQGDRAEAFKMAKQVWKDVDLPNLNDYILPTRTRADVILHKTEHHYIDRVYLRED